MAGDELKIFRPDFWVETSNKQLNFIQHVVSLLKPKGRAAVVVPDNVLFESGAAAIIRKRLLQSCKVHTLLRLPTGLFYAQGVKANVLFFDKKRTPSVPTGRYRIYDLRSHTHFSLKSHPIQDSDLAEFVSLYSSQRRDKRDLPRWRSFDLRKVWNSNGTPLDLEWVDDARPSGDSMSRLNDLADHVTGSLKRPFCIYRE